MDAITIRRPDDFHLHLREGEEMRDVVLHSAERFGRAVIMPNLASPVLDTDAARAYRDQIIAALPRDMDFEPLMTLYLTDMTTPDEVERAADSGIVCGLKLYPAGTTTNSERGVSDIKNIYATLDAMQALDVPLLIHGEVSDPDVDIFDRETEFISRVLVPLLSRYPELRMVFEHITTAEAASFVEHGPATLAATITAHHLLINRNALFSGGISPHHYCLPILKREHHRQALLAAAASGNPKFFLGTDSAPHSISAKQSSCGCAGIYTAHAALEIYTEIFDSIGRLDRLEGFASVFGAEFYGLTPHTDTVSLTRESWRVPTSLPFGKSTLVPLRAGELCQWQLSGN